MQPIKATILDDDKFRLLAIPFGGSIPHPAFKGGIDLDGETFTERTDIKPKWFNERPTDWHHGNRSPDERAITMGRSIIGKAVNLQMDEEGWWVDVWLNHGERRVDLIRRLAQAAADTGKAAIFGSSEPMAQYVTRGPWMDGGKAILDPALPAHSPLRRGMAREIRTWPYLRQTLSTSPQNILSTLHPLKATLDDLAVMGSSPSEAFWSDIEDAMRNLSLDLRTTSRGEFGAKAGRVLNASNEKDLRAALAALEEALARANGVLSRQPDYTGAGERLET